ncbi:hypothetical protein OC834_003625 [Tilletia horrida]|nr:hypothetical protein OC834_003625 [Tilletia horrida]
MAAPTGAQAEPLVGASTSAHKLHEITLPSVLVAATSVASLRPSASRTLHCEAASGASQQSSALSNRLPIYDQPEPPVTLVETHTELERQIGSIRRSLQSSASSLQHNVQDVTSSWIARERAFESRVRSLAVPEEPLNPGLLYVGVATLSASVFTRYRSFPIRFLAPPLFFVGSLNYFLPKTSSNLGNYYIELEHRYFPTLTGPRQSIVDASHRIWNRTEGLVEDARDAAAKGVKTGLQQVEKGTGLRVGEVMATAKAEAADIDDARRLV